MLIELNGLSFHLEILRGTGPSGLRARIIDEAFELPPMECPAWGPDCVTDLIAGYSGIAPDNAQRDLIAGRIAEVAPVRNACQSTRRQYRAPRMAANPVNHAPITISALKPASSLM